MLLEKRFSRMLIIILSICILMICSCSKRSTPSESLRVLYLTIWADALNAEFHNLCQEWSDLSGVRIEVEDVPLKDLSSKLASVIEAKAGADLAIFPAHLALVHHNQLADVTDLVTEITDQLGEPYNVARDMNRVDRRWISIPIFAWSHIWVYRKDLLDSLGLSLPDTWGEAAQIAQALTDPDVGRFGLGIGMGKDDDAAMFFQSLLWSYGGSVFSENGRSVVLNSPATRLAVQWMLDLYYSGFIPPGALGWDGASNNKNFLAEKIAITANSPTIYYVAKREKPDLAKKIVHSVYPKGPAGRYAYATGFSLAYFRDTKRSENIESLVRYIMCKRNYERLIKSGEGSVNPLYSGIDAIKLWDNEEKLRPALETLIIEKPVGWPGPVTPKAAEVFERRILTDMFGRIINDGLTIDEAVLEATKRIKDIMKRH